MLFTQPAVSNIGHLDVCDILRDCFARVEAVTAMDKRITIKRTLLTAFKDIFFANQLFFHFYIVRIQRFI